MGAAAADEAPARGSLPAGPGAARGERGPGARAARGAFCRREEGGGALRVTVWAAPRLPRCGGPDERCQRCSRRTLPAFGRARVCSEGNSLAPLPSVPAVLLSVPAVSALPPNFLETCVVFRLWQISFNIALQQNLAS